MRLKSIVLAIVITLTSVGSAGGQEQSREQLIAELLSARSKAVNERNLDAFLATVDQGEFRRSQQKWFERIGGARVTGYSLELDMDSTGDLSREKDRQRYGAEVVTAGVRERYIVEGYDSRPTLQDVAYTFVKREGGWRIASDSDLEDIGILSARNLWEFEAVQRAESEHFVSLHHPGDAAFAREVVSQAESALTVVGRAWKGEWEKKVVLIIPSSSAELERLIAATFDVSSFVAFATGSVDTEAESGWDVVGPRVIINPDNFSRYDHAGRVEIFAHELVHIATQQATGPHVLRFIDEGLAELTGERDTRRFRSRAANNFDRKLPEDWEFFTGSGAEILSVYQESTHAMAYLERRYGLDALNKFYASLGAARVEPGTATFHLDRATKETFGIPFAQLESEWAASVP